MTEAIPLEIRREGKEPRAFDIAPGIYSIGSDEDCKVCLSHPDVDGRHAILTVRADGSWLEDLGAATGTRVGGQPVHGRADLPPGTPIQIGPYELIVGLAPAVPQPAPAPKEATPEPEAQLFARHTAPPPEHAPVAPPPAAQPTPAAPAAPSEPVVPVPAAPPPQAAFSPQPVPTSAARQAMEQRRSIKHQIHQELVERLDIKRMSASRVQQHELQDKARSVLQEIINDVAHKLPPDIQGERLLKEVFDEAMGLGPLEDLLEDESVTEIMVNGPDKVYVERSGRLVLTDMTFMDDNSVLAIIERIVAPIGRRIDESQPYVDARLPDGSRVNAIIAPLSLVGPCLTIRKFSKTPFTTEDLIRFGTMTRECATFMDMCIKLRKNVIVSGGTGSGKTSLLNVFSSYLPTTDRILTIEDAAELRLTQDHVVRLEARPPNIEGRGAIAIRDLVRNALRMRPDRVVVGECRGGEALDMLQAMNTGHDGSLTTVHANAPRDVISRLETMVLMSGMDLPVRAIREQVASAVDIICHEMRFSDGSRKVTKVTEVLGLEGDQIVMQDIFEFVQTGVDENGKVLGHFGPTGAVPTFLEDIESRGMHIDRTMFNPTRQNQP